jgi:hypothetical protein
MRARILSRLTILLTLILFLTPILLLAQEAAVDPEAVAEGTDWLAVAIGLLATNGLVLLLALWNLVKRTKLKAGATKVMSVLWAGADKAIEGGEALKAVLAYLADPTEANKARAEKECADLRITKG